MRGRRPGPLDEGSLQPEIASKSEGRKRGYRLLRRTRRASTLYHPRGSTTHDRQDCRPRNRPDVHGGMVCAGVNSGLIAPTVSATERWETLWHYMQSGPGVFKGDLYDRRRQHPRPTRSDRRQTLPAVPADGQIRLFLHGGGYARHRKSDGRPHYDHERTGPLPDELGSAEIHLVSVAGAGQDPRALTVNSLCQPHAAQWFERVEVETEQLNSAVNLDCENEAALSDRAGQDLGPCGQHDRHRRRRWRPFLPLENTIADDGEDCGNGEECGQACDHHQPARLGDHTRRFRIEGFFSVAGHCLNHE